MAANFSGWLARQAGRGDRIGVLGWAIRGDPTWPIAAGSLAAFRAHLRQVGACRAAVADLEDAWREWCAPLGPPPDTAFVGVVIADEGGQRDVRVPTPVGDDRLSDPTGPLEGLVGRRVRVLVYDLGPVADG